MRDRKDATLDGAAPAFDHAGARVCAQGPPGAALREVLRRGIAACHGRFPLFRGPPVGTVLAKLADEAVEEPKSHAEPMTSALAELEAAIAAQQKALDAEAQAYGIPQSEKIAWLDAYLQRARVPSNRSCRRPPHEVSGNQKHPHCTRVARDTAQP